MPVYQGATAAAAAALERGGNRSAPAGMGGGGLAGLGAAVPGAGPSAAAASGAAAAGGAGAANTSGGAAGAGTGAAVIPGQAWGAPAAAPSGQQEALLLPAGAQLLPRVAIKGTIVDQSMEHRKLDPKVAMQLVQQAAKQGIKLPNLPSPRPMHSTFARKKTGPETVVKDRLGELLAPKPKPKPERKGLVPKRSPVRKRPGAAGPGAVPLRKFRASDDGDGDEEDEDEDEEDEEDEDEEGDD